jgi:asparagine synthase (glutamine-hydrolysing)
MTIIAGLFRCDGRTLDESLCKPIRAAMSRDPADTAAEFRSLRCYLAKVDIGAYGESAFERRGETSAAVLAGDPLLTEGNARTRTADLSRLHDAILAFDFSVLRATHGSFCSAHYSVIPATLTLVVDQLALRPLYCWHEQGFVAFASALRILEGMIELRKSLDTRGLCEQLGFGYPLGDRTAYQQIRCLCAGEVVTFSHAGERRLQYWRWDLIQNGSLDPAEAPPLVHDAIRRAVARRLKTHERSVAAFLSGGLDSRLIATVLRDSVGDLQTFTFADEKLLDRFLAQEYSKRLGSRHHAYPAFKDKTHPSAAYGELLASADRASLALLDRPQMVWSGDGGSVCMGYVYLGSAIVELFRHGLAKQAIDEFLRFNRRILAARRILGTLFARISPDFTARAMEIEIDSLRCNDPAMKPYIFLLLNDQRRHLSAHFECIDMHRTELHLPLFDSDILELMIGLPIEEGLYHKFYYDMMEHFPTIVRAVPWQAYPGHLPCPLPVREGLIDQWRYSKGKRKLQINDHMGKVNKMLRDRDFSRVALNRKQVYLASWITRLGIGDRSYLCEAAATVYRHWEICSESMHSADD